MQWNNKWIQQEIKFQYVSNLILNLNYHYMLNFKQNISITIIYTHILIYMMFTNTMTVIQSLTSAYLLSSLLGSIAMDLN
jgi:hypothetical protein